MSVQPTARLLLRALQRFEHQLQQGIVEAGYADVTVGHMNLIRHLDAEGMRLSTLAEHAGITKQAVTQGVKALQARDLVHVEPDPDDGRAKRVVYTPRGEALIREAIAEIQALEQGWLTRLGEAQYQTLRDALEVLGEAPSP